MSQSLVEITELINEFNERFKNDNHNNKVFFENIAHSNLGFNFSELTKTNDKFKQNDEINKTKSFYQVTLECLRIHSMLAGT